MICCKCKTEQSDENFVTRKDCKRGRSYICKSCTSEKRESTFVNKPRKVMTVNDSLRRLFYKFKMGEPDECWEWIAARDQDGYGLTDILGRSRRATRIIYQIVNGDIPEGIFVCHKCDHPWCVNPNHLFLGTPLDNMLDKVAKGRQFRPTWRDNPNYKLSDDDVAEMRSLLSTGKYTLLEIAERYNVSFQHVSDIKLNKKRKIKTGDMQCQ